MRIVWIALGHLALVTGTIGIFVPLLPTTPFVLLAAFCYSRGSERIHQWLLTHPRFGRIVSDWREHGVIRPRAKVISVILLVVSLSYPIVFRSFHWSLKLGAGLMGLCSMTFILTRPSRPRTQAPESATSGASMAETAVNPDGLLDRAHGEIRGAGVPRRSEPVSSF